MAEESFKGVIDTLREQGEESRTGESETKDSLKHSLSLLLIGFKKELTREGQLTRNRGVNSFKSLKNTLVGNDLAKAEKEKEQQSILQKIADGISDGNDIAKDSSKKDEKEEKGFFSNLLSTLTFGLIGAGGIGALLSKIPGFDKFVKFLPILKKLAIPLTLAIGLFKGVVEGIKGYKEGGIIGAVKGFFEGVFDTLIGDLALLIGSLGEKLFSMIGLGEFGERFNEAIQGVVENFKGFFGGVFDSILALFSGDTEAFKEAVSRVFESVKGFFNSLLDGIQTNLELVYVEIPSRIISFIKETAIPFMRETVLPKMVELATNVYNVLADVFSELLTKVKEYVSGLIPESVKKVGSFVGKIFKKGESQSDAGDGSSAFFNMGGGLIPKIETSPSTTGAAGGLETSPSTTGAALEVGMSDIANAKAQPAPVMISGGSSPQTTTVNTSTTNISGGSLPDESNGYVTPSYFGVGS